MSEMKPPLTEPNWQEAIDRRLQDRLMRPAVKPGIIDTSRLARRIMSRSQGNAPRLPLLSQLEQRWAAVTELPAGQVPVVYAQLRREQANASGAAVAPAQVSQRVATPTVQAKFAPAGGGAGASGMPVAASPMASTGTAEPSPLPVAPGQPVQRPSAQAGLLPAVSPQPPGDAAAKAHSQPAHTQASPMPVVPAKFTSGSNLAPQVPPTGRVLPAARVEGKLSPGESPSPPEFREVRENRLPATGKSSSPLPVVRVTTGALAVQQPPSPLLRYGAAGSATVASPAIAAVPPEIRTPSPQPVVAGRPAASPTGAGTPLVLPVPPALAAQGREANSSQPLASAPHSPGTGSAAKTAAPQQTGTSARLPPAAGAQTERNVGPGTERPAKIDTDELADKIERKLMRRLTIENERRGQGRWR